MAEIIQRDGSWAFDGSTVRITPGLHRSVALFRQTYGEIAVPRGDLWGSTRRDLLTALVATAVTARLPHPSTRATGHADRSRTAGTVPSTAPPSAADHHDILLRRLRELGDLHRDGVLTDEEFAATKAAVLRDF